MPKVDDEAYRERLAHVTLAEPARTRDGRVILAEADPEWPLRYELAADGIRAALGEGVRLLEQSVKRQFVQAF